MGTFFEDLLKEQPKVPNWATIDPSQVQGATNQGNLASFQGAQALAQQFNDFSANELMRRLREAVPEFAGLQGQMAGNLAAQLRGELTQSDLASTQRESAAGALGKGFAGSGAGAAYSAFNVGRKQFEVQQSAQAQAPAWLQTVTGLTRAPMYDLTTSFLSAPQRFQMTLQNQENQFSRDWLSNQVKAQPTGVGAAFAKLGDEQLTQLDPAANTGAMMRSY